MLISSMSGITPGWVRVNFNYFLSEIQFQFLLDAIHLIATDGWRLLPHYTFDPDTGEWRHRNRGASPPMRLDEVSYRAGKMEYRSRHATEPEWALPGYVEEARRIVAGVADELRDLSIAETPTTKDFDDLRWFPLPSEVLAELRGEGAIAPSATLLHP